MRNDTKLDVLWNEVEDIKKSGGSNLPEVTSADNGKILGVENGAWSKMDAPSGGVDYSTTEVDTGLKWIDNSPIYQRTFTGVAGSDPLISDASGINIIGVDGYITKGTMGVSIGGLANSTQWTFGVHINANNELVIITGSETTGGNYNVTIRYTKNTTKSKKKTTKNKED